MGNMLESDSSNSDDGGANDKENVQVEVKKGIRRERERTAGDGMDSDLIKGSGSGPSDSADLTEANLSSRKPEKSSTQPQVSYSLLDRSDRSNSNMSFETVGTLDLGLRKLSIQDDKLTKVDKLVANLLNPPSDQNQATNSSPRQLPSRDLLIPIRPQKLENKSNTGPGRTTSPSSYDKFTAAGVGKPNNKPPKFVPYEPYSCAVRPMAGKSKKTHSRKTSDSSSIVSQSSVFSGNENGASFREPLAPTTPTSPTQSQAHGAITVINPERQQKRQVGVANAKETGTGDISVIPAPVPANNTHLPNSNQYQNFNHTHTNNQNQNHNHSVALMKDRLKIAEKEASELQTENARLKKLLVNAISGNGDISSTSSTVTQSMVNNNGAGAGAHSINESYDNLSDELEVWRSKFLSSCVLVEQLSKDNHRLGEAVSDAAEIIKDLKNTASLTQTQYTNINEWFRKANVPPTPYTSREQSFSNSNANYKEEYFEQDS